MVPARLDKAEFLTSQHFVTLMNVKRAPEWLLWLLIAPAAFAAQDGLLEADKQGQRSVIEQRTAPSPATTITRPMPGSPASKTPPEAGKALEPPQPPAAVPPERIYSAGRRAEPRLWEMLNGGRYIELDREIQRLRTEDPNWQPPAELTRWLRHHLAPRKTPSPAARSVVKSRPPVAKSPPAPAPTARYGAAATLAARLDRAGRHEAALQRLEPWASWITQHRDAGALELLAWLRFKAGQYPAALADFRRVLAWRFAPSAAQGELLALERLQRYDELIAAARRHAARRPELAEASANALRTAAAQKHRNGAYPEAGQLLAEAAQLTSPDRGARLLAAWNEFQLRRWRSAADRFAALYRETPDEDSAQGLYLSLRELGATAELAALAGEPGPLQTRWAQERAEAHYSAKRFLSAYAVSRDRFPALSNIDGDSIGGGLAGRWRSGESGTSRLREWSLPAADYEYRDGTFDGRLTINRMVLDSGALAPRQAVGTAPDMPPAAYPFAPTTELSDGWSGELTLRREGEWTPHLLLGITPSGGELSPSLYGAAGLTRTAADYRWDLTAHALPVRESLLSYTGIRDPYLGDAWGQVFRQGVELQGWRVVAPRWTVAGVARADIYRGEDVADNHSVYFGLGLGRDLGVAGFDYFAVGPTLDYAHFDKNLNHFTRGNGGYYSPQRDLGLALALNFQSAEGQEWLVRGRARLGVRHQYEAAGPWLPLAPDGRFFASTKRTGFGGGGELQSVWRLAPHWQLGAAITYDRSPTFEQGSGYLFLRYLFEPRPAVFGNDLRGTSSSDW